MMFKNPFSFKGRIRRTEYGLSYIIYLLLYYITAYATFGLGDIGTVIFLGIFFVLFWFYIAQSAKRCHDRGNSGWYQLIPFYPLWLLFADGDVGPNRYGPNPKNIGNFEEIDEIGKFQDN